jgi:hypothetical protein
MKRSTYKAATVSFFRSRDSLPVTIPMIVFSLACIVVLIMAMAS